jgi:hypothetical protein
MATPRRCTNKLKLTTLDDMVLQLIELLGHLGGFVEEWKDGPYEQFRHTDFTHDDYLDALRALESGPVGAEGLPALVQRMRRLAFSIYTVCHKGVTSLLFDLMMNPRTDYRDPPLTTAHVDIDHLNTLFGTSNVTTLLGSKVGISHAWGAIDVAVNGVNVAALAAQRALTFDTPTSALATWLGDLGNAVREYEQELQLKDGGNATAATRRQILARKLQGSVGKGDLLGDLDGIAIGSHWARSPHAFTASTFLQEYYDNDTLAFDLASRLGRPSASYRFHYFLKYVEPRLPSGGLDSSPFVATFDKAAAQALMPALVARAADDMLKVARIKASVNGSKGVDFYVSADPDAVASRTPIEERLDRLGGIDAFRWMCDQFCQFIDDGVRTGDGVWPPPP